MKNGNGLFKSEVFILEKASLGERGVRLEIEKKGPGKKREKAADCEVLLLGTI